MKKKMSAAQKKAKAERQKMYERVFMNGKQVRIKRPEMIDGMLVDDWLEQNADEVWLIQNRMYDIVDTRQCDKDRKVIDTEDGLISDDSDIPF